MAQDESSIAVGQSKPVSASVETTRPTQVVISPGSSAAKAQAQLTSAATAWIEDADVLPLERWMAEELDDEGIPCRLAVPEWIDCLDILARARRGRTRKWPVLFDARIEGFFRQVLRFSRPDGTPVFSAAKPRLAIESLFRDCVERSSDASLGTVVDWWFPSRTKRHLAPPVPAWAQSNRPLAMLRADWSSVGDLLAVDHRENGSTSRLELRGLGRTWLGPAWNSGLGQVPTGAAKRTLWVTNPSADLAEWSFRVGPYRVVRTALLLRGRRLALLADQLEGGEPDAAMRIELANGVEAAPLTENRGLALTTARKRSAARVFPIGLPCAAYATDRGAFRNVDGSLVLSQRNEGGRCWLPLLVSWEPARNRRPVNWRLLTVTEKSRICPAERAVAARISWGRDETLVIYRSLARPAIRAFLGHQTRARFLVALFDREGNVEPIVKIDD